MCSAVSTNFAKDDIAIHWNFLFAVSHFSDNVTQPLGNNDGEKTKDIRL